MKNIENLEKVRSEGVISEEKNLELVWKLYLYIFSLIIVYREYQQNSLSIR